MGREGRAVDLHEPSLSEFFREAFDGAGFAAGDFLFDQHLFVPHMVALAAVIAVAAVTALGKLGKAEGNFLHFIDGLFDRLLIFHEFAAVADDVLPFFHLFHWSMAVASAVAVMAAPSVSRSAGGEPGQGREDGKDDTEFGTKGGLSGRIIVRANG